MTIQFVKSNQDFDNYLKNNKYIIANFTATWCGPCQAIKPLVDKAYEQFSHLEIVRIDLDSQRDLSSKYTVTAVPTFIFFTNGKETDRVKGGNIEQLFSKLDTLNKQAEHEGVQRKGNSVIDSQSLKGVKHLMPKGYDVLNSTIDYSSFEILNSDCNDINQSIRDFFNLEKENVSIQSDSDSQLLLYIPLLNISKIFSILVKVRNNVDEDEELQPPNLIKVWANTQGILSFEEAVDDKAPLHSQEIEKKADNEPSSWIEIKLKYVKFQNVQNLTIFFDGEDEDYHTRIEKLILVGVNGESRDQGTLPKFDDEE